MRPTGGVIALRQKSRPSQFSGWGLSTAGTRSKECMRQNQLLPRHPSLDPSTSGLPRPPGALNTVCRLWQQRRRKSPDLEHSRRSSGSPGPQRGRQPLADSVSSKAEVGLSTLTARRRRVGRSSPTSAQTVLRLLPHSVQHQFGAYWTPKFSTAHPDEDAPRHAP